MFTVENNVQTNYKKIVIILFFSLPNRFGKKGLLVDASIPLFISDSSSIRPKYNVKHRLGTLFVISLTLSSQLNHHRHVQALCFNSLKEN